MFYKREVGLPCLVYLVLQGYYHYFLDENYLFGYIGIASEAGKLTHGKVDFEDNELIQPIVSV